MRYCDKDLDIEVNSPASQISYIIILVLFAPIRFFGEMGKRLLLLGEYTKMLLNLCLIMNACLIFLSVINSYCITKIFNIFHGTLNLVSLGVCFVFNVLLNVYCRFSYNVNLDNLDNLEKEEKLSDIEKMHNQYVVNLSKSESNGPFKKDVDVSNNKAAEKFLEDYKEEKGSDNETLEEKISNGKMDGQSKEDLFDLTHELKKSMVSPVYKHDREESDKIMLEKLREKLAGRCEAEDDDRLFDEYMSHTDDKEWQVAHGMDPETYDMLHTIPDTESDDDLDPNDEVMEEIVERKIEEARAMCRGEFNPNSIEAQMMMQDLDDEDL